MDYDIILMIGNSSLSKPSDLGIVSDSEYL